MIRLGTAAGLSLLLLSACNQNPPPPTACAGDKPAVERVLDAAPPNCSEVLPGAAPAGAVPAAG